jgi:hypothetical protein
MAIKESTVIAELIRQALDMMLYKLGDRPLNKSEILGVSGINHKILLRGNTNLEAYGWAIYSGPRGTWQVMLNHNRFVRGTPKAIQLSAASRAMLASIPETHGLYSVHSAGLGFRSDEIRDITEPSPMAAHQWRA